MKVQVLESMRVLFSYSVMKKYCQKSGKNSGNNCISIIVAMVGIAIVMTVVILAIVVIRVVVVTAAVVIVVLVVVVVGLTAKQLL